MEVWKFGGTSVGLPERMKSIKNLVIEDSKPKIIVLSALSGTTNNLLEIGEFLKKSEVQKAKELISELKSHYVDFVETLFDTPEGLLKAQTIVNMEFGRIMELTTYDPFELKQDKELVAQGEIISTQIFNAYLNEQGFRSSLISALDFMRIDEDGEPVFDEIEGRLKAILKHKADYPILITQGFICRNHLAQTDNLKRGGSDYTASLIGAAIEAEEIQIWTDIDGFRNNDPRIVKRTMPVRKLTFEEAAELAYFGAKILHPNTITPARKRGVSVRLKSTLDPLAPGTVITESESENSEITAVAAKDNITAIYIHSMRMLNAYGFLRKVFEIFEKYKTPVDMITTAEVSVAVTIDNSTYLDEITSELSQFAELEEHDRNQTIICVVGQFLADKPGIAIRILEALRKIPVRMISYGASEHNVSVLIDTKDKNYALEALNEGLFKFD